MTEEITKLLIDLVKQKKFEDFFNKYGIENGRIQFLFLLFYGGDLDVLNVENL